MTFYNNYGKIRKDVEKKECIADFLLINKCTSDYISNAV